MSMWPDRPICAFDLETTGRDPLDARIVTACVAVIDGPHTQARTWLLDPEIPIPDETSLIHGITTEHAHTHGQQYETGYREIRDALYEAWTREHVVVAFNACYDLTVMHAEGIRIGLPDLVTGLVVDPYVIDREKDRYRKGKRTLQAVCAHYGVALEGAHEAQADALAAAHLARVLTRRYPDLVELDIMASQADWHGERQRDFADYLLRQGRDASDVNEEWPIRRMTRRLIT